MSKPWAKNCYGQILIYTDAVFPVPFFWILATAKNSYFLNMFSVLPTKDIIQRAVGNTELKKGLRITDRHIPILIYQIVCDILTCFIPKQFSFCLKNMMVAKCFLAFIRYQHNVKAVKNVTVAQYFLAFTRY